MHGRNQNKAFQDSTFMQAGFYLRSYVYKAAAGGDVEPKFFTMGFHIYLVQNFFTVKILLDS